VTAKQRVVKLLDMSLTNGQLSMQAKTLSIVGNTNAILWINLHEITNSLNRQQGKNQ